MAEPLRIAMITHYPAAEVLPTDAIKPKYRGGEHPASWIRSLTRELAKRDDVRVRVVVHSRSVGEIHRTTDERVEFVFLPKREPIRSDPLHGFLPAIFAIRKELREFAPHIVHGHGSESGCMYIATRIGPPSVISIQGILAYLLPLLRRENIRDRGLKFYERRAVMRATGIIAKTGFARTWALSVQPAAKIGIIPNAVNEEFLHAEAGLAEPLFLLIGGFDAIKNPALAIRAFARVSVPDARLCVIGDGPERATCVALAASLGVGGRVEFAGRLNRHEIIARMKCARAVVVASRMETSPNVITEAHAAGLPVIATRAGGIPDMVADGRDGFLVDCDDEAAMAARMRQLLDDPSLAGTLGKNGKDKVAMLQNPKRIAAEHVLFYREIAGLNGNHRRSQEGFHA